MSNKRKEKDTNASNTHRSKNTLKREKLKNNNDTKKNESKNTEMRKTSAQTCKVSLTLTQSRPLGKTTQRSEGVWLQSSNTGLQARLITVLSDRHRETESEAKSPHK